jgi:phage terminase large subunit-like protein
MINYIFAYYQEIQSGGVTVGKWTKLAYEYVVHGLQAKSFFYDGKKAARAVNFIEKFCHHHEGELAPGLIKLELWQKAALSCIFGIVDETGARQFREVLIELGRKNGKTLVFGAAIAEYCALLDGEYGGRIYMAAPKLEQANLCFSAFYQMILQEPMIAQMCQKRRNDIYIPETNTTVKPLAFSAKKSDGLNVSLCIADEIASWPGEQGLKFYEVIKSSFGARRQPLLISITTAGYVNEGIYDELHKRATRLLLGDSKEKRFLPILYCIDEISRWNDITELQKSMPNLGTSVSVDYMLEEIAIAEQSLSKRGEFITKYCNIKQNASTAWLSTETVEKCCGAHMELEDFRDSYAVVGVDLSKTTDLTAVTCVIEKNGILNVFAHFFLPEERLEEATEVDGLPYEQYIERGFLSLSGEHQIDYHDVEDWIVALVEKYEIYPLKCGYDRWSASYLVQDLRAQGFHMDDVYQGDNLYGVLLELESYMKDGKVNIGDNDLLKVHLLDGCIKMNTHRGRGKLEKLTKTSHIDGAAALVDAMTVRQKWYGEIGEQLKNIDDDEQEEGKA